MDLKIKTASRYKPIGMVYMKNGCCPGKPVIITANLSRRPAEEQGLLINYSCQCACNSWCTSGHASPAEALAEYEDMTRRFKAEMDTWDLSQKKDREPEYEPVFRRALKKAYDKHAYAVYEKELPFITFNREIKNVATKHDPTETNVNGADDINRE